MDWDNSNSPGTYPPEYYSALEAANSIRNLARIHFQINVAVLIVLWACFGFIANMIGEAVTLFELLDGIRNDPSLIAGSPGNPIISIYIFLIYVFLVLVAETFYLIWVSKNRKFSVLPILSVSGLAQQIAEARLDTTEIAFYTPGLLRHFARAPQPDIKSQLQHVANHLDWYLAAPAPYYPNTIGFLIIILMTLAGLLFPAAIILIMPAGFLTLTAISSSESAKDVANKALFAVYITANLELFKSPTDTTS